MANTGRTCKPLGSRKRDASLRKEWWAWTTAPSPPRIAGRCSDAPGAAPRSLSHRQAARLERALGEESLGSGVAEGRAVTAQSPAGSGASLPGGGGCLEGERPALEAVTGWALGWWAPQPRWVVIIGELLRHQACRWRAEKANPWTLRDACLAWQSQTSRPWLLENRGKLTPPSSLNAASQTQRCFPCGRRGPWRWREPGPGTVGSACPRGLVLREDSGITVRRLERRDPRGTGLTPKVIVFLITRGLTPRKSKRLLDSRTAYITYTLCSEVRQNISILYVEKSDILMLTYT